MAADVQIALQPQAGQDPAAAVAAAASRLVRLSMEMLAQQVGQSLAGKVLAAPPNFPAALTQIAVADQIVTLKLSSPLPAGTPVRIDVQQPASGAPTVSVQPHPPASSNATAQSPARAPMPVQQMATPSVQAFAPAAATPAAAASPSPRPDAPTAPNVPAPTVATTQPLPQSQPGPASAEARPVTPPAPSPQPSVTTSASLPPPAQAPTAQVAPQPAAPPASNGTVSPAPQTSGAVAAPAPSPAPAPVAAPLASSVPTPVAVTSQPASVVAVANPLSPAPTPTGAQPTMPVAAQPQATASGTTAVASNPPPTLSSASVPTSTAVPLPTTPAPATTPPALMQRLTQAFTPLAPVAAPPASGSAAQLAAAVTTQAAAQQQSAAPLLQSLAVRLPQLPPAVAEAAARLLNSRINLDRGAPSAAALKQAVLQSGVFLDAPAKAGTLPDTRQALLGLRSALLGWLGGEVEPVPPADRRPPPPARGDVPRAHMPEMPPPATEGSAKEAGKAMLSQTEGALSRIKLMQLTSQPTDTSRLGTQLPGPGEWNLELPLMLGRELAMAQIQINRDGKGKAEAKEKHWRLRFALKFSVLGEVGAQVSMLGSKTSVALWADESLTADALEEMLPELAPAFAARGLELVSLSVRRGAPRDEARPAGRLMDSLR